jgi:sialate O-acetylesterase
MDAFTTDLAKIGVPTAASGTRFQQNVANMNVYSNVKGIVTGKGLAGGNIEFWSSNYGQANGAGVPNAAGDTYDFGDQPDGEADGYGCMQVHNHDARQTLFALNHWSEGEKADIGIGKSSAGQPDWTFAANANTYQAKRLRVLVRCQ